MTKIRITKIYYTFKSIWLFKYENFFYTSNIFIHFRMDNSFAINPITSSMATFYEKTKSNYSKDIDHLVNFNKNGLWIKEELSETKRIISTERPEGFNLINVKIYHLDKNSKLIEKILADKANIESNTWTFTGAKIFSFQNGV